MLFLSITSTSITVGQSFSVSITVYSSTGDPEPVISIIDTIPSVNILDPDPGVTYTTSVGQVVISGTPLDYPGTSWTWLDTTGALLSSTHLPTDYSKIIKVESPPSLPGVNNYVYTIEGLTFTLTVTLPNYNPVQSKLKSLLETVS
jgi:hypothetical protein